MGGYGGCFFVVGTVGSYVGWYGGSVRTTKSLFHIIVFPDHFVSSNSLLFSSFELVQQDFSLLRASLVINNHALATADQHFDNVITEIVAQGDLGNTEFVVNVFDLTQLAHEGIVQSVVNQISAVSGFWVSDEGELKLLSLSLKEREVDRCW